jgi:hypothetical protein
LEAMFSVGTASRLYSEEPKPVECSEVVVWWMSSVECWQFSRALQGKLRRDGAIVEWAVDKSSDTGDSPDSIDVSAGNCRISTVRSRC